MSKSEALRQLAKKRCEYKLPEYSQPEDFPAGPKKYCFHEFVSPYSKGAFNINSQIMFVLQDWSSADALRTYDENIARLGRDPKLLTNKRLKYLLRETCQLTLRDVYATNAFPLIKNGGISARIPRRHFRMLAEEFLRHEIRIVAPRYVIALGALATYALRHIGIKAVELPHPARRRISLNEMSSQWRIAFSKAGLAEGA
jgi:uracil-DNA glycosylase